MAVTATLSATVITDAVASTIQRTAATAGDGLGGPQLVLNGSFPTNVANWTASNGTLTRQADAAFGPSYTGAGQLVFGASAAARYIYQQLANVQPDLPLVVSLLAYLTAGSPTTAYIRLYDPTLTTKLAEASFSLASDVTSLSTTFSSAQIAGYTNPILVLSFGADSAILSGTVRVTGVTAQPPGDYSVYVGEAATNLCANGSFETNTTGWAAGSAQFPSAGGALSRDTTLGKIGTCSLKFVSDGANTYEGVQYDGAASANGTVYTLALFVRGTAGKSFTAWLGSSSSGIHFASTTVTLSGAWQLVVVSWTGDGLTLRIGATFNGASVNNDTFWIDAVMGTATPYPLPYADPTRAAGRLQLSAGYITQAQGWLAFCVRMDYAAAAIAGLYAQLFVWDDNAAGAVESIQGYIDPSGALVLFRQSGTGAATVVTAAIGFTAHQYVLCVFQWTPTTISVSVNNSAFVTASRTYVPATMAATFDIANFRNSSPYLNAHVMWVLGGTGTLGQGYVANLYSQFTGPGPVPSLTTFRALLSATAGTQFVYDPTQTTAATYVPQALTGSVTVVSYLSAAISFAGAPVPSVPPALTVPTYGMPIIYYRPGSRGVVQLDSVLDAVANTLLVPGATATAYVTVTNQVTGASYRAQIAMIGGVAGSWSYVGPDSAFPGTPPLLVSVQVYDISGSGGTLFGTFEAICVPLPAMNILYQRNSLNQLLIQSLQDNTGALRTPANTILYATLTNRNTNASILAQTMCIYAGSPGNWQLTVPPFAGEPVVNVVVDAYDVSGSSGQHLSTWLYRAYRR